MHRSMNLGDSNITTNSFQVIVIEPYLHFVNFQHFFHGTFPNSDHHGFIATALHQRFQSPNHYLQLNSRNKLSVMTFPHNYFNQVRTEVLIQVRFYVEFKKNTLNLERTISKFAGFNIILFFLPRSNSKFPM